MYSFQVVSSPLVLNILRIFKCNIVLFSFLLETIFRHPQNRFFNFLKESRIWASCIIETMWILRIHFTCYFHFLTLIINGSHR
jgi:hypothetical protein